MDSLVTLALMRKVQLTFELDGNFMSFPLTSRAYGQDDFAFVQPNPSKAQWILFREFSDMVDQVPRGPILEESSEARLSSIYTGLLRGGEAQLAVSTRTETEESQYREAMRALYVEGGEGLRSETPMMSAYRQYRDAWFTLKLEINNRRIDADYSTDPEEIRRWKEVDEPALEKQLADLEGDWTSKGFRADVERAQLLIETLGAKSPSLEWKAWDDRCLDDIDRPTEPVSHQQFWPSAFSPSNAFDAGGWTKFSLEGGTVEALAKDAPGNLRGKWEDQADVDIERLTFECTSLRVERPWYTNDLFRARFWRLPDGTDPISTGAGLTAGRCPAYVAAVVLARDVDVRLKRESSRNTIALQKYRDAAFLPVGNFKVAPAGSDRAGRVMFRSNVAALRAAVPVTAPPVIVAAPRATVRPVSGMLPRAMAVGRVHIAEPVGAATAVAPPSATRAARVLTGVKLSSFATKLRPVPVQPSVDPAVHILGFICKNVPRCPDPDPTLQW